MSEERSRPMDTVSALSHGDSKTESQVGRDGQRTSESA